MSANQCSICMENYNAQLNPPYTCNPCAHVFCKVCIDNWRSSNHTCPECRDNIQNIIPNRALLELIESDGDDMNNSGPSVSNIPLRSSSSANHMDYPYTNIPSDNFVKFMDRMDLLKDKSNFAFFVIDNSGSMQISDGKIFEKRGDMFIRHLQRSTKVIKSVAHHSKKNYYRNLVYFGAADESSKTARKHAASASPRVATAGAGSRFGVVSLGGGRVRHRAPGRVVHSRLGRQLLGPGLVACFRAVFADSVWLKFCIFVYFCVFLCTHNRELFALPDICRKYEGMYVIPLNEDIDALQKSISEIDIGVCNRV